MHNEGPTFMENQIESFPKLDVLTRLDGTPVSFSWKDKNYEIAALGKDETQDKKIFLGLWEVGDFVKLPVGYCDASLDKVTGQVVVGIKSHDLDFFELPIGFKNLENIELTDEDIASGKLEYSAFMIDKKYRRTGISDVFNAQTIVLFQALGAREVLYKGDITVHSEDEASFIPNFKEDTASGLVKQQPATSFYSKYSTNHDIEADRGVHAGQAYTVYSTKVEPRLSSLQISLLREAGL